VLQVDARIAPEGDPDRNAVQLREHLVDAIGPRRPTVRWMAVTAADLGAAVRRYAADVARLEPIDVVHLGLGDDGHTASWPPGDHVIDSARVVDLCGEFNGRRRMTLTPHPVNGARCRLVLAAGPSKAPMVARFLAGDQSLPISRVRRTGTVLFLDRAAAPAAADR
jgi:6-phosphogluconolactonase/glucosamine-6-phosphate isomerase/deaminase